MLSMDNVAFHATSALTLGTGTNEVIIQLDTLSYAVIITDIMGESRWVVF